MGDLVGSVGVSQGGGVRRCWCESARSILKIGGRPPRHRLTHATHGGSRSAFRHGQLPSPALHHQRYAPRSLCPHSHARSEQYARAATHCDGCRPSNALRATSAAPAVASHHRCLETSLSAREAMSPPRSQQRAVQWLANVCAPARSMISGAKLAQTSDQMPALTSAGCSDCADCPPLTRPPRLCYSAPRQRAW